MKRVPVVVLCTLVLVLGGCAGEEADAPETTAATTTEPPTEATTEPTTEPTTAEIVFYDPTVEVQTEADLDQLEGAPQDFLDFVASQLDPDAGECAPIVSVFGIDPSGFASGGISGCGGAQLVWKRTGDDWTQVAGTQDTWSCDELDAAGVPVALLAGPEGDDVICLGDDGVQIYTD